MAAGGQDGFIIDVVWVVQELINDGLMAPDDQNLVISAGRERAAQQWHPFQVIVQCKVANLKSSKKELDLNTLTDWLADRARLPLFHIDPLKVDVHSVTATMSYAFAERHHILAVQVRPGEVVLATAQPFYRDWETGLSQVLRDKNFKVVVADPAEIHRYRIEFYNLAKSVQGAHQSGAGQSQSLTSNFEQLFEISELKSADANDQHVVNIVDWLLQYAFDQRASDIHLEPRRDTANIRFRIDGVLHDVYTMPAMVMSAMTSRLKILGRLNVAEKRRPQDGRLKTKNPDGSEIELRISTLPTAFGEKMVMRIFDPDVLVRSFSDLGFSEEEYTVWLDMVTRSHGMVLVTGPTGSGKTTTLYSTLKQLATSEVNVCTLEDPIEMVEPAFNQVQIQASNKLNFADGIRALLRQDPDIIMVGEIRDLETAEMAIQAALTGHLVISTLHTNDAPSAVVRLMDLGVPPYLISATVIGVMAQRLLRTLCPHCKKQGALSPDAWRLLTHPWKAAEPQRIFTPVGCLECRDTGYRGRVGVYEILSFTEDLKNLVTQSSGLQTIARRGYRDGMRPLRINGAAKVASGLCTPEEVLRVTPNLEP
jgi:general secretion pathway protein E